MNTNKTFECTKVCVNNKTEENSYITGAGGQSILTLFSVFHSFVQSAGGFCNDRVYFLFKLPSATSPVFSLHENKLISSWPVVILRLQRSEKIKQSVSMWKTVLSIWLEPPGLNRFSSLSTNWGYFYSTTHSLSHNFKSYVHCTLEKNASDSNNQHK